MLLKDRIAVIHGAGGAIGSAVAGTFAREGARLFLSGRSLAPVWAVAEDIVAAGGKAEAASVDALDEVAIERHTAGVVEKAGRIDVVLNAIGFSPVLTLAEVANTAAFLASDKAGAMTGAVANLTGGMSVD